MKSRVVKIGYNPGIHFRPADKITTKAFEYKSNLEIVKEKENAYINAKSFLSLVGAGLKYEDEVLLKCDGEDEDKALDAMAEILENINQE